MRSRCNRDRPDSLETPWQERLLRAPDGGPGVTKRDRTLFNVLHTDPRGNERIERILIPLEVK